VSDALQHTESGNSPPGPSGAPKTARSSKGMPLSQIVRPEPAVARTDATRGRSEPLPLIPPEVQPGVVPGVAIGTHLGYAIGVQPVVSSSPYLAPQEVGTLQRESFQENSTPVEHSTVVEYSTAVYLTFAQVADLLQVTPGMVSKWGLEDASFPVTRLPGRVMRVERRALDRWLARRGRTRG